MSFKNPQNLWKRIRLMICRIFIGIILLFMYVLVFTGTVDWFAGFNEAQKIIFKPDGISLQRAKTGIIVIYLLAISSIWLIIFSSEILKNIGGVFLALVTIVVLYSFS